MYAVHAVALETSYSLCGPIHYNLQFILRFKVLNTLGAMQCEIITLHHSKVGGCKPASEEM